ncbi:MAG: AMP-binding protein [Rhodobacter sp.]|nr:AMP-binding protein [Rhodobacter sp.]
MTIDPFLAARPSNFKPLTPLDFLERALAAHPNRVAMLWRGRHWSYGQLGGIVADMAEWLEGEGIGSGDVVSVICPNRPEMLSAHFAVPMRGAVLNSVNTRLDAGTVAYILTHSSSRLILCDPTCRAIAEEAGQAAEVPCVCLSEDGCDSATGLALLEAAPRVSVDLCAHIADEWQPIALNYTSGTTSAPKGVVLHHRGAYLNALGNVMSLGFDAGTAYLWTLPMFHCNGWCHTWAVTAAGGLHICLDRVDPDDIFDLMARAGVTHMSCAPVVLHMLLGSEARAKRDASEPVVVATGGAAPTSALIAEMDALGFDFIHLYGLTESFGPASLRIIDGIEQGLDTDSRADLLARQGVRHVTAGRMRVLDEGGTDVPADGLTPGEIVLVGNTVMAGYLGDQSATEDAFKSGVFHTGDIAVMHPSGEIEIRDRSKDVIISGGENISSLEVEGLLHEHPAVMLAAVVAKPDPKWGEIPCAFLELKPGQSATPEELQSFCRDRMAHFKVPRMFLFEGLPRTATGKIRKVELRARAKELS